jgi:hypothetical protein
MPIFRPWRLASIIPMGLHVCPVLREFSQCSGGCYEYDSSLGIDQGSPIAVPWTSLNYLIGPLSHIPLMSSQFLRHLIYSRNGQCLGGNRRSPTADHGLVRSRIRPGYGGRHKMSASWKLSALGNASKGGTAWVTGSKALSHATLC